MRGGRREGEEGRKGRVTLGRLTSMMDLSSSTCSFSWGYLSFRLPAAASTDFTARIPVWSMWGGRWVRKM